MTWMICDDIDDMLLKYEYWYQDDDVIFLGMNTGT